MLTCKYERKLARVLRSWVQFKGAKFNDSTENEEEGQGKRCNYCGDNLTIRGRWIILLPWACSAIDGACVLYTVGWRVTRQPKKDKLKILSTYIGCSLWDVWGIIFLKTCLGGSRRCILVLKNSASTELSQIQQADMAAEGKGSLLRYYQESGSRKSKLMIACSRFSTTRDTLADKNQTVIWMPFGGLWIEVGSIQSRRHNCSIVYLALPAGQLIRTLCLPPTLLPVYSSCM